MRNTEDKVYACTYADTIESKKEGDCGENEEGKGRKREAKRERERSPTVILHGTKRREEARAPVMYADCKSAIMSLSRVYGNPQHRRGVPAPSLRSISLFLPLLFLLLFLIFLLVMSLLPMRRSVEDPVCTQNAAIHSSRKAYRARWHGTAR